MGTVGTPYKNIGGLARVVLLVCFSLFFLFVLLLIPIVIVII